MINFEQLLAVGGFVASAGIAWGVARKGHDGLEKRFDAHEKDVWREVGKLRDWRHEWPQKHETEAANERLKLYQTMAELNTSCQKQYSDMRVSVAGNEEKFKQIIEAISELREAFNEFRKR